jgi:tetratricopeptide (TPR) repeat protein
MIRTLCFVTLFFSSGLLLALQVEPELSLVDPQTAAKSNAESQAAKPAAHEEELYSSANQALNNGNYDQAISGFDQVAAMRGHRGEAALFWKAYTLNKAGRAREALATIQELKQRYPRDRWTRQAASLETDIRSSLGEPIDPEKQEDEEEKMVALSSLMHSDPDKAIPILEKVLRGNGSFELKDRALFVLAQSKSDKAQQILLNVAKGNSQPELQTRAIKWLAIGGGGSNGQALQEIYASTSNPEVKSSIIKSFLLNHDTAAVFKIAQQEKSPELREQAIKQLGIMHATTELRQLYKSGGLDADSKDALLKAMGMGGDVDSLIEIAKTETDPNIRARAIKGLGISGGQPAVDALVRIYNSNADVDTKKLVVKSLFIHQSAKEMVALARKETNPELRKELVRDLSIMHSPEATDYMLEILNK